MATAAAQKVKRVLLEVTHLSKAVLIARPTTAIEMRHLLQKVVESNQCPTVGIALLNLEKEIVYIKYEGAGEYLRKRMWVDDLWNFSSITGGGEDGAGDGTRVGTGKNDADANGKKMVARVAFMITKMQKKILRHTYMYSEKQVKALKPIEALLIIEHNIHADDEGEWRLRLDQLVNQNEQMEEENRNRIQAESNAVKDADVGRKAEKEVNQGSYVEELGLGFGQNDQLREEREIDYSSPVNSLAIVPEIESDSELDGSQLLNKQTQGSNRAVEPMVSASDTHLEEDGEGTWYEVIEVRNGSLGVIALYKTKQEAQECLDIKIDLMRKRAKSSDGGSTEKVEFVVSKRVEKET